MKTVHLKVWIANFINGNRLPYNNDIDCLESDIYGTVYINTIDICIEYVTFMYNKWLEPVFQIGST